MDKKTLTSALQKLIQDHPEWLPKNCRKYTYAAINNQPNSGGSFASWPEPQDATVIFSDDDFTVIKPVGERTKLVILPTQMVHPGQRHLLAPKTRILATPYAPKEMDGTRLQMMKNLSGSLYAVNISAVTRHGLTANGVEIQQLLSQIEHLRYEGRTIVQMLLDAGAVSWTINDPCDQEILKNPPSLTVRLTAPECEGFLSIVYDRAMDYYMVRHVPWLRATAEPRENIDVSSLAEVIADIVGQECMRYIDIQAFREPQTSQTQLAEA